MGFENILDINLKNNKRRNNFFNIVHATVGELCLGVLKDIKESGDAMVLAVSLKAASDSIMEEFVEKVADSYSKEQVDRQFNECLKQYKLLLAGIKKHNMSIEAGEGDHDG